MSTKKGKNYGLILLVLTLFVATFYLFRLDFKGQSKELTFAMLDIGQGDGLFIESPTGTQVLVDAGPPKKILNALPKVISPFDKSLDAIIFTHPDQDHIGGFADVLKNYKVGVVLEPGSQSDSKTYQNLETEIKNKKIPEILAKRGMRLDLGGGAMIDILFPDRDVSDWDTNDSSIVSRLSYGNFSVMLTGDATFKTEEIVLSENSASSLQSTVLKVGHHGSKYSSSPEFVQAVAPTYAAISVGAGNKYGHPSQEALDTLNNFGAKILRTDLLGTVTMQSDGKNLNFSFKK